jgi:undecaprenyl diphosphate synthase
MMSLEKMPIHIAIIPDGNRRWARSRGLLPWDGHAEGAKIVEKLIKKALNLGIKNLSFWGSSLDNLKKRPYQEKRALLKIYLEHFNRLAESEEVHKNKARINVIGKWEEQFPEPLKKIIKKCINATKNYRSHFLNFFLAYNGDDEMIEAVKKIIKNYQNVSQITAKTIKENLMTKDLPPVDLLIRTGGDPHNSVGFMMWDTANSQMYFTQKLFPDFDEKEFEKAIEEYQRRERRMGR